MSSLVIQCKQLFFFLTFDAIWWYCICSAHRCKGTNWLILKDISAFIQELQICSHYLLNNPHTNFLSRCMKSLLFDFLWPVTWSNLLDAIFFAKHIIIVGVYSRSSRIKDRQKYTVGITLQTWWNITKNIIVVSAVKCWYMMQHNQEHYCCFRSVMSVHDAT